ncbi:protein of unknown function [Peptoclostridium litorale DSM 5388]|uniref:DUF3841 domain-containing protein n=1 Tax=Peptoclostridium litorale DSM 5388 TaxID=1121324 RepID=A0A069RDG2_PEPLI|nr:DUF3841 domain-containing protein [Peptoclostridium litorale]KDR94260.1 hypothetical protein CLIT_24c00230 [Peptoclostridium litorale DSM 5388]SIO28225.1 protein of unknown function [Peptoclostridium litorale DSM 5388]
MRAQNKTVTLYACQRPIVWQTIQSKGVYHVKKEFITQKYQESAKVFLHAYNWFVSNAEKISPRPEGAEYAVWVFTDPKIAEGFLGDYFMVLEVPLESTVFFDKGDWNKVLNMGYIENSKSEKLSHMKELEKYGIRHESEVFLTPFYPQFKSKIQKSWQKLFRFDSEIKKSGVIPHPMQAAIWELKKEWIREYRVV